MATITASAAGGASNTNGAWVGGVQPTAADDVIIDATSAGITIPSTTTLACRSLNASNGTLIFAATTSELDIGDANGGALTFNGSTTLTLTGVGLIKFVSTKASTTFSLTTGGRTLPSITVATGSTTTIACADALIMSTSGTFTSTTGKFDAASFSQTWGKSALGAGTKSVTFGTSSVTVTASSTNWDFATNNSGLTLSAASSTITCSGASNQFNGGNLSVYGTVNFTGSGSAVLSSGPWSCTNLSRTGTGVKTDTFQHGTTATITVTGVLTINGNSVINRMLFQSNVVGTARTISAASVSITNCDFQDITAAGAGNWDLHAITGLSGDCGGNSGITFTTPATQTHTASAGGNWSDVTKWTSRVPLPQDNVIVNINTTGTLTADMPRLGASIDFTGFAATFVCSVTGSIATIFGSLTLASGMTWTPQNTFVCQGRGNQTITSHGITTPTFVVQAGTYVPQDALAGADNTRSFSVQAVGVFDNSSNNVSITYSAVNVLNTSSLIAGAATWTLTATSGTVWNHTAGTMSAASATIVISAASTSSRTFAGLGKSYGTITYTVANSPGQLVITGANTFTNLNIGLGRQLQMPASTTNTFANAPSWSGAPNGFVYLPGVSGAYASAPDTAALSITGDITIDCKAALDSWTVATAQMLVAKAQATSGQQSYQLFIDATGHPIFDLYATPSGINNRATSSAVVPFAAGAAGWFRVTWRASDGRVQFFTSTDDITYTQLGTDRTIAIASIADSTAILEVGSKLAGTNTLAIGKFYRARVYSDITQTTKVFDADFTAKTVGANSFTESSTNAATVTINGALAQAGDGRVALTSSTPGTQATVNYTGTGVVNSDYLTIQDSNATPGSTWYAGTHSSNVSGNTGWTFTAGDSGTMSLSLALTADSAARAVPTASLTLSVGATAGVSAVATASLSLVTTAAASAPVVPTASLTLAATAAAVAPVVPIGALELALTAAATAPITPTGTLALLLAAAAAAPISPTAALDLLLVATAMATPTVTPAIALLLSAVAAGTAGATMDLELLASASAVAAAAATMMLELDIVAALALAVLVFDLNAVGIRFGYLADPVQAGFKASAPAVGFVAADTAFGRQ